MSKNTLMQYLNENQFTSLHVTSNTGTNLVISLDQDHTWLANNDELYIEPDQYGITGTYVPTQPVTTQSNTQISDIHLEFADGKAIEYSANINTAELHNLLEQSADSAYVEMVRISKNQISLQLDAVFVATGCSIVGVDAMGVSTDITAQF